MSRAERPVENVWDYPRPPALVRSDERIVVEVGGAVLARTERAWCVLETSHPPTYYLPWEDVDDDLLVPSDRRSWCEWKGRARYFDVVVGELRLPDAAWTYPDPTPAFVPITDHLALYPGRARRAGDGRFGRPGGPAYPWRVSIPSLDDLRAMGAAQQPTYADPAARDAAVATLRRMPPLVFAGECDDLRDRLASVARGEAFLLQGGDCAETFEGVTAENVRNKLRVLLSMAVVLTYAASVPVVKVGRLAGQYAKPRSSDTETRGDVTLPAYRGDAVNGFDFTPEARAHDPQRLVDVYNASSATLNLARAFTTGGYADLRQMHVWNTDFVKRSPVGVSYERVGAEIDRALAFMDAIGVDPDEFHSVDFYSSHEALVLEYEHALTRIDSRTQSPYDVSGHFVWIGERTRQLDGAHVELLSHIANPIGVKLGPTTTPDDAIALYEKLNPERTPGKVSFITRFGAGRIRDLLPHLVEKVTAAGIDVAWICDPMHGNTFEASSGYKTREFDDVIDEVRGFFEVHRSLGTWPGGLHVELTGDDVTECVGGGARLSADDLSRRYETLCDPRLNREQSLELAFLVAEMLRDR